MFFSKLPTTPITLVIGLVIATCFIAYLADNLGKSLGKKRITLFGLRPRQTATMISMASSVAVMAFTLGALLIASAGLRNSLLHYDGTLRGFKKAKKENEHLQTLLPALSARVKSEQRAAEKARAASAQTQRELAARRRDLSVASDNLSKVSRELQTAQRNTAWARLQTVQAQQSAASARENQNRALRGESAAKSAASEIRVRLVSVRGELEANRAEYRKVDERLKAQRTILRQQQAAYRQAKTRAQKLALSNQKVLRANGDLLRKERELLQQLQRSQSDIDALEIRKAELEKGIEVSTEQLRRIAQEGRYNTIVAGLLGAGRIAVNLGQVLAETRLPASSEPTTIRAALRALLDNGAEQAGKLSDADDAAATSSASPTLELAPQPVEPDGEPLDEAALITHYSNYLSTFKIPVSLRVAAARNYAPGEKQFEARLVAVPIRRAFVAGETLTSSSIDGNATDAQIFDALVTLMNAGEKVARERGVVPLLSSQNPYFYASGTNERIFEALRETQMRARLVRVRLVADGDASTVDNVRVKFVLEKVSA